MDSKPPVSLAQTIQSVDLYSAVGGLDTCRKLSAAFYHRVAQDPVLRHFFPGKTLRCAIEAFADFLVQFLGGPQEHGERQWWLSLRESHLRFKIGQKERDAWMHNMLKAFDDVQLAEPARGALQEFFTRSSAYLVNQGEGACPLAHEEKPGDSPIQRELAERWNFQRSLDEIVSAVRSGDAAGAIALTEHLAAQAFFHRDRRPFAGILALMMGGNATMLEYVRQKLSADPSLARENYSSRTLLHWAAAAGNLPIVELLLQLGADPNAIAEGGKTPLYCLANECTVPGGGDVVHVLVRSGASVDANDNLKRCTPLHMAARRNNVEVAKALLDCGANMEARDSFGDTPLRRAVNCNQTEVARLLLSRGADRHSKGSKTLTPLLAARTSAMKQLFHPLQSR